jgi:hypothetical protein
MNFQVVFWTLVAIGMFILVPIAMIWTMVDHLRGKGSDRSGSGAFTAGIGAAMQELDRLMSRPSIEHKVDTENRIVKREDDAGDD